MRDQPDLPGLSAAAVRVLRADQASDRELHSAYQRFGRRPQQHAPGLLVSRWLLAGLVMGLGMAFAADAVVQRLQLPSPAVQPALVAVPGPARKAAPLDAPLPSPQQDLPEPTAEPLPSLSESRPARAPSVSPKPAPTGSDERSPADSAVWAKAAQGLRDKDLAQTEAALSTLEHAGSTTDREAARLIRAQLMLHQGDVSGARAVLEDLLKRAQSAQVRAKAQALLSESAVRSNSALNPAPSGT